MKSFKSTEELQGKGDRDVRIASSHSWALPNILIEVKWLLFNQPCCEMTWCEPLTFLISQAEKEHFFFPVDLILFLQPLSPLSASKQLGSLEAVPKCCWQCIESPHFQGLMGSSFLHARNPIQRKGLEIWVSGDLYLLSKALLSAIKIWIIRSLSWLP